MHVKGARRRGWLPHLDAKCGEKVGREWGGQHGSPTPPRTLQELARMTCGAAACGKRSAPSPAAATASAAFALRPHHLYLCSFEQQTRPERAQNKGRVAAFWSLLVVCGWCCCFRAGAGPEKEKIKTNLLVYNKRRKGCSASPSPNRSLCDARDAAYRDANDNTDLMIVPA